MPYFRSKRKVQGFGSSLAITLPALFVKGNEIKKGCDAFTFFSFDGLLIVSWLQDKENLKQVLKELLNEFEKEKSQFDF